MTDMLFQFPLFIPGPRYATIDRLHEEAHESADQAGLFQNEFPVLCNKPLQEEADHVIAQPLQQSGSMNRTGLRQRAFS